MSKLPDKTNFYCSVDTELLPKAIAQLYAGPIWHVRKCSLKDFEAISDFAEVVIESSNPVLIHGPVMEVLMNSERIIEPIAAAGLTGTFECFDASGRLILEKHFAGTQGRG